MHSDDAGLRPVLAADRFHPLCDALIALLCGLDAGQWTRPTSAGAWTVRDVVAHLLDGDLRRLSIARDGHLLTPPAAALHSADGLVAWLDALNATWVDAARRVSPRVLTDLLAVTGPQIADLMEATDPFAPAPLPVAWAGEGESPAWLDVGRELTERWHHQDQIREAVGAPPLDAPHLLAPVVAVSMRALPNAYRNVPAHEGAMVRIDVTGAAGGTWTLARRAGAWRLTGATDGAPTTRITLDARAAARLLLHRCAADEVHTGVQVSGDTSLATAFFAARAVMVRDARGSG